MDKKQPYRIVASGKKAERRDYSESKWAFGTS